MVWVGTLTELMTIMQTIPVRTILPESILTDQYQRQYTKLRVSVWDACNYRCSYCMPDGDRGFLRKSQYLSVAEITTIVQALQSHGIKSVRITGGEPTLRKDFIACVQAIGDTGITALGLTTNGWNLTKIIDQLAQTRLQTINVSLDSFDRKIFKQLAQRDDKDQVVAGIIAAKDAGFAVKVNCVLMRGINDHEVDNFIAFAKKYGVIVRFLELMKIGSANAVYDKHFIAANEVIHTIKQHHTMIPILMEKDATSFNFLVDNTANIGFIASESKPFCGDCSRLRLSANGELLACLFHTTGIQLRNVPVELYPEVLAPLAFLKPNDRIQKTASFMNQLGG